MILKNKKSYSKNEGRQNQLGQAFENNYCSYSYAKKPNFIFAINFILRIKEFNIFKWNKNWGKEYVGKNKTGNYPTLGNDESLTGYKEIASFLGVSTRTLQRHLKNIPVSRLGKKIIILESELIH